MIRGNMETKEKSNEEISDTETKRIVKLMSRIIKVLIITLFILCAVGFMMLIIQAIEDNNVGMLVFSIPLLLLSIIFNKIIPKLEIKKEKKK